jgi:ATP-dependent helicase/nuclease subunit A
MGATHGGGNRTGTTQARSAPGRRRSANASTTPRAAWLWFDRTGAAPPAAGEALTRAASSLVARLSDQTFEVAVEPAAAFQFEEPLAGRWVRYWPWPYGGMSTKLALLDAAGQSPEAARAIERDGRERLRLLYVGFTRARDLLVTVAKVDDGAAATAALAPLDDEKGKPRVVFPFDAEVGPGEVRVGKRRWPCAVRQFSGLRYEAEPKPRTAVGWYAKGAHAQHPPERLNPSSEPRTGGPAKVVAVTPLGKRRELSAGADQMGALGDAIHAFLAADVAGDGGVRRAMAARLLAAHGVEGAIDPRTLLEASESLHRWLDARYPGAVWRREWPVRARLGGDPQRLLVGEVDLFLELPDGFVLVDHKSFPGSERERDRRLTEEWAPQLGWYADALARALGKPLKAAFIHLPIRGEMAEVEVAGMMAQ